MPQLVVQASSIEPVRDWNSMPDAFEKFCPRKCDVPVWMAFRSLDHRLDAKRLGRLKALAFGLLATDHRNRQEIARKGLVNAQHPHRFLPGLGFSLVRGVAFLPQELGRAKKQSWPQLPANDVCPLVEQDRQVAPGFYPTRVGCTNDRLRCRANDERFVKGAGRNELAVPCFQAVMRHDGAFLGEALDVCGLLLEIAQRYKKREVGIAVAGRLEHPVQDRLHPLPQGIAPRFDDHATSNFGVFGEIGRPDDLLIPLGKVLLTCWRDGSLLGHAKTGEDAA